jgi:hypothetical protein
MVRFKLNNLKNSKIYWLNNKNLVLGCLDSSKNGRKLPLKDNEKINIETLFWKHVEEYNNLIMKTFTNVGH